MKVLKRNQIIILVIALMLVSAGYLNFARNQKENTIPTTVEESNLQYAGIGDAKLVSSNGLVDNDQNELLANEALVANDLEENQNEIAQTTSNEVSKETSAFFSTSRLNRETMYSQMIESYQKILENESISETQKAIAQTEIQKINETKNKIMICENLIKTKDITDLILFVNDKSVSVVIRADKLEQEQIAQIQNIISREMQIEINDIHISNK